MKNKLFLLIGLFSIGSMTAAQADFEATEHYFNTIKNNPSQLTAFLKDMPKGGDLHNHTGGASLAENMIIYAKNDHFCVDRKALAINSGICTKNNLLNNAHSQPSFYNAIINAWSMRHFQTGKETAHDHFFATFDKNLPILMNHDAEIISEAVERAGEQNELYLELMDVPDNNVSGMLGKKIGWDENLVKLREKLLKGGLKEIIANISKQIDKDEAAIKTSLHCGSKQAKPGCMVTVRYLYQPLREQPPEQVFAQMLAGFEAATQDSRIVGINLVQAEDHRIAMRDYHLHMQMIQFLHHLYPTVAISLHAGELTPLLAPPNGLRFHIRDAIETAGAIRIGHGVAIKHEDHFEQLLKEMAVKHILVEINLTSNAMILNVEGKNHPLTLYMQYNVPVALSTDDEGVFRINLTHEYEKAILTYHFSYATIKKLARNSIAYSFLPGETLWSDYDYQNTVPACKKDNLGAKTSSLSCKNFLDKNEKARMQWALEKQFVEFENRFKTDKK